MGWKRPFTIWASPLPNRNRASGSANVSGMYTSDSDCKTLRVQWHRFEPNSSLDELIRTVPHVAFKVADLDRAIAGCNVLLGPYEPIADFRVAIIEDGGQPIELVETTLTNEELWRRAEAGN